MTIPNVCSLGPIAHVNQPAWRLRDFALSPQKSCIRNVSQHLRCARPPPKIYGTKLTFIVDFSVFADSTTPLHENIIEHSRSVILGDVDHQRGPAPSKQLG